MASHAPKQKRETFKSCLAPSTNVDYRGIMSGQQNLVDDAQFKDLCMALASAPPLPSAQFQSIETIAVQHAVRALLRDRVLARRNRDSDADERYCAALTDLALREAALEARRNEHLINILEAFVAAGVAALLFKGAALAHSHYPRPELREREIQT